MSLRNRELDESLRLPGSASSAGRAFAARLEPFDSYWQGDRDLETGYDRFERYYRANYLPRLPRNLDSRIAVLSCGPGYLVNMLIKAGYRQVVGIDANPEFVRHATDRNLPCHVDRPFEFLEDHPQTFDMIIPEQELNHLSLQETIEFLQLCGGSLRPGGQVLVYAINGANPLTSPEHLSHNIDHFYSVTEYSLRQLLELAHFTDIQPFACRLYVFWNRPENYIGWLATRTFETTVRVMMKLYGKRISILSKRIAAVATITTAC